MKLKLYLFLLAISSQFMFFGQTLDQSNTSATAAVESLFGGGSQNLSQSFTVGITGQLSRISVNVDNVTNGPTLYVNCDLIIYSGEGFGGAVLGTHGFAFPDNVSGEFAINFTPIAVTSNQVIAFKIVANTTSSGRVTLLKTNDTYSGGVFYNGTLQAVESMDLWFKTYIQSAATHLNFDGVDDYVTVNVGSANLQVNNYTHELWFRTTSPTGTLFNNAGTGAPNAGAHNKVLSLVGGKLRSYVYNGGGSFIESSTNFNDGNWHHVAEIVSTTERRLYVDGILVGTSNALPTQNLDYITLGNSNQTPLNYYNGDIDEVRIWNTARTLDQINASKNCELQGDETALVLYYKFNQGVDAADNSTITTLTDATVNAYNGVVTNFTLTGSISNFLAGSPVTTGSILPLIATVTTPVVYNQGVTASALTATTGTNGNGLMWYTSATGGTGSTTAPTPSTATAGNTSYWVASSNANGCESARTEIVVTVNANATHLNFDGVNDVISINNPTSANFTIETYIKTSTPSPTGNFAYEGAGILDSDYGGVANDFNFSILNNKLSFYEGSINLNLNGTTNIVDGNWHHVAVVRTANESVKIYLDGVLESQSVTAGSVILNQNPKINIGASINASKFFNGSIDEVRIWNRTLPIEEIQNNMNCELSSPTTQNGLVAYYQFNQGNGAAINSAITTLTDASGNSNTGTLNNFALTGTTSNWLAGSTIVTGTNCEVLSSSSFDITANINLYPNPTNGKINIDIKSLTNVSVSVYDLNGRVILNKNVSGNDSSVDMSTLQTGIYLFKIKATEGEIVKKVIKN